MATPPTSPLGRSAAVFLAALLCLLPMPALWMMNANDSSSVLDVKHLRYGLFRHSKEYYACGDGRTAEANDTSSLFLKWYQDILQLTADNAKKAEAAKKAAEEKSAAAHKPRAM